MKSEFIKELADSESGAKRCIVKLNGKHYLVSSVTAFYTGFETLVFPCNENGENVDWEEVAGGRGMGRTAAITDLERKMTTK